MNPNLAELYVDLKIRGAEEVKKNLDGTSKKAEGLNKQLSKIGAESAKVFAGLSATITGTVAAANPAAFDLFTGALKAVAIVVGVSLLPLLMQFTAWIIQGVQFIGNLDSSVTDTITTFIGWTAAITGVIVVVKTLWSIFGGLFTTILKFAATNPLLAAFLAITAAAVVLISKFQAMNDELKKVAANSKKIMDTGEVTEEDIKKSWVGKDLMSIKDPKERAAAAQKVIDSEVKRGNEGIDKYQKKNVFARFGDDIGAAVGIKTESSERDKVYSDAQHNIAVATAIRDKAAVGKDVVPIKPQQSEFGKVFSSLLDGLKGNLLGEQTSKASIQGLGSVYNNIAQATKKDPALDILEKLGLTNKLLEQQTKAIEKLQAGMGVL